LPAGEIGAPNLMHIISRDPAPPPLSYVGPSGGIFMDMTIHDFDMARFLIGDEVEEIYTAAGVFGLTRDRQGRRSGHRAGRPALPQRRHRHHRQLPQGSLRLRPAG
jgi:predicted dehydrogenase